ncbi:MAG: PH domain-containing protein [bacterium]|nr:PH domain-containing protein [bacterium]
MQLNMSPTREKYPLSFKKITKKAIAGSCGCLIVLFIVAGVIIAIAAGDGSNVSTIITISIISFIVLAIISILPNYLYQRWYFATYYYELSPDYIIIKKGPITPREITIPYERVQDVYMDQDILDRIFGLYDVHLSSATVSSGMQAHIDGLEKEAAEGLRTLLLNTVSEKINRQRAHTQAPAIPVGEPNKSTGGQ